MDARRGAPVLVSPDVRRVDTACRRELILGHCHPAAIIRDAFPDVGSSIGSYSGHSSRLRVPGGVCQNESARVLVTCTRAERRRPARKPGQVAAAGCRSRRGIHTGMAGEGHARSRQIRDRANRFALSRARMRIRQLPCAGSRAKTRGGSKAPWSQRLRTQALRASRPYVRLRHRAAPG